MSMSSSNGHSMAASAARRARFSPDARPVPIMAVPLMPMTVCTSAKSTFMTPWLTIRSEMPSTAPSSTSLAAAKAFMSVKLGSASFSLSLEIVIRESTYSAS